MPVVGADGDDAGTCGNGCGERGELPIEGERSFAFVLVCRNGVSSADNVGCPVPRDGQVDRLVQPLEMRTVYVDVERLVTVENDIFEPAIRRLVHIELQVTHGIFRNGM